MRFIIHEQPFEKPLAAGLLRYEQDGRPTGTVEHWRLTDAAEGYRFFRVDLDAREAKSGDSYLYHLVLSPDNRPERLKFRFYNPRTMISGDLLIEDSIVTLTRDINDQHFEESAETTPQTLFWYPSAMGLGMLAYCHPDPLPAGTFPAVTLDKAADFALKRVNVTLQSGEKENLAVAQHFVAQQTVAVRPLSIRWQDQTRTLWLNPHKRPVKMVRNDGLTAVETRHIHY